MTKARNTTRPRAGRQTRPHRTRTVRRRREKLIGELRASHLRVRKIFALKGVFDGPEVETVAPRHGAPLAAENRRQLAGAGRDTALRTGHGVAERAADAGAGRRAEPRQPGDDHPAGRLVRHHGHRLLPGFGRLLQPQGRAGHDGGPSSASGSTTRSSPHASPLPPREGIPVYRTFLEERISTARNSRRRASW